ncbi:ATP-binding cassette domain-containing protein [Nitrosococcus watsonii]|uniref:ABC transporter related protein n=1 Tax=Nitrosococcus watsoni (strain C-113) TaxID=105559 RepID=D8K5S9_NITWC|nr:ATP-binding cassette domain-containing protein [Nitrosococcus watsonii]ADJ28256.1 ABC transporter related protein [Nitrosococcus watsonii C-113]
MACAHAVVTIKEVSKTFATATGSLTAIAELSATFPSAGITSLVGPDGAGKTTLMRLIAGLLLPSKGIIQVLGQNTANQTVKIHQQIGYMPQSFGLYEELTVRENLNLYADLQGLGGSERQQRFKELLRFTGLTPFQTRPAGKLSGGMKQKLGLASTLIRPPRLLLLDEPSVGVDPLSRRELWNIVRTLISEGMAVLWSTAYLDEAERSDRMIVLDQGRKIYDGTPQDFIAPLEGRSFRLSAPQGKLRALQRQALAQEGIMDAALSGQTLRLVTARGAGKPRLEDLIEATEIKAIPPCLEDAYIAALQPQRNTGPMVGKIQMATNHSPQKTEQAPIQVKDLTRRFGAFIAVNKVSFSVRRGEIFGLLGPNGAGKSTIFKMLAGLLPPTEGEALVAGVDLRRAAAKARGRIGYMAQHFSLYAALSVQQNLRFFAGVYGLRGRRRQEQIKTFSKALDLAPLADQISGSLPLGYKQRLSLACAIMHEPEILFLDEPTSGVDPLTRREFWLRINEMAEQGVTVLVTTHFMEEAEYCNRLAIIYQGQLIALGSPDALKGEQATPECPEPSIEEAFIHLIEARQPG